MDFWDIKIPKEKKIFEAFYEEKTWFEARDYCDAWGGDIASINSFDQMKEIKKTTAEHQLFWIGFQTFSTVWI